MNEEDVLRMQLDIETFTKEGYAFPNAERESDEIIIIALSDSTGREMTLTKKDFSEADLIAELSKIVKEFGGS